MWTYIDWNDVWEGALRWLYINNTIIYLFYFFGLNNTEHLVDYYTNDVQEAVASWRYSSKYDPR